MSIFNAAIFNNTIFNTGEAVEVVKTGTGGIDPVRKRRTIYKPTGLLAKRSVKEVIEQRIEETRETHEEIKREIALSFREEIKPISQMTISEVDQEIGRLLKKKLQTEEEEMMMLLMMISSE